MEENSNIKLPSYLNFWHLLIRKNINLEIHFIQWLLKCYQTTKELPHTFPVEEYNRNVQ